MYTAEMNLVSRSFLAHLILNLLTIGVIGAMLLVNRASAEPTLAPPSSGITPTTLSYQGNLTDASGQAINTPTNLTFRLYNTASGGAALWTETQSGVSVTNGLFSVELGAITPVPESIWDEEQLYLGVRVGSDSEMSPREMIGKVPIAAQAVTVPDGSITSGKLGLDQGTACLSGDTTVALPGDWTPVEVLSLPFSLEQGSRVVIWMDGLGIYRQTGSIPGPSEFTLYVDTTPYTGVQGQTHPAYINIKGQRILSLPAGNHTLILKTLSFRDGTMEVRGSGQWQTCVNYVVLGE